jgi:hypothetical protein
MRMHLGAFTSMAGPAVDREMLAVLDDTLSASNTDKPLALVPPDVNQLVNKHDLAVVGAEMHAVLKGDIAGLGVRTNRYLRSHLTTTIEMLAA